MSIGHIIMMLVKQLGEIRGRTLLQKLVYFVGALSGRDFGHYAHYFGPFSSEVAYEVDRLVGAGFLTDEISIYPINDNPFGEIRCHTYRLTSEGQTVVEHLSHAERKATEDIVGAIASHAIGRDLRLLSIAAKAHFIRTYKPNASTDDELKREAKRWSWNLTDEELKSAKNFLNHVNLV